METNLINSIPECLRVACDLMMLFFIIDEYTDNTDRDEARTYADMVANVFENPHVERPQGESIIGEITRQYVPCSVNVTIHHLTKLFVFVDSGCAP